MTRPRHLRALEQPYQAYIDANGGEETCGICGRPPKPGGRKLHRDHDHRTGALRGLLCWPCNRALPYYATIDWMILALGYLRRAELRGKDAA